MGHFRQTNTNESILLDLSCLRVISTFQKHDFLCLYERNHSVEHGYCVDIVTDPCAIYDGTKFEPIHIAEFPFSRNVWGVNATIPKWAEGGTLNANLQRKKGV